ncbi:MAG: glycoside hydrolase family 57 protein [Nitrososphaeria archaeon]|jgi:alpha-amylase
MTDIVLVLEIHQPRRLNRMFPYERVKRIAAGESLIDRYFDDKLNREIFGRVSKKCYNPTFDILSEIIKGNSSSDKPFKLSLGMSGMFLHQAALYEPQLVEKLKSFITSGSVELLGGTYYHSLSSLSSLGLNEFAAQVKEHKELIKQVFGYEVKVFENTELIYNNGISKAAESLGFQGVLTEGVPKLLEGRSPTYVYSTVGAENIKLLLRHCILSDDIGFRFSLKNWGEYPLTADKYAAWLSRTGGDVILISLDIETFGEHHWAETGIFDLLKNIPKEVAKAGNLNWSTPSEVVASNPSSGSINVPETATISWADAEKDCTAWLDNSMQRITFDRLYRLEPIVKEINDAGVTKLWRFLQQSDHFHYMSTKTVTPEATYPYFSPFSSPAEAFAAFDSILSDFEGKIGTLYYRIKKPKPPTTPAPQPQTVQQKPSAQPRYTPSSYGTYQK